MCADYNPADLSEQIDTEDFGDYQAQEREALRQRRQTEREVLDEEDERARNDYYAGRG